MKQDKTKTPPSLDMEDDENNDADILPEEKALLDAAGEDDEERDLRATELDTTDDDGEPLNELSSANAGSGSDLDVPGSEDDDTNEEIGEEDEENNSYSVADNE